MLIESARNLTDRHVLNVINGFYTVAAVLGLPSAAGFLYFGWAALQARLLTPAPSTASQSSNTAVGLIETFGQIFAGFFRLIGAAGQWVATGLTLAFFVGLVVALALFLTGRGLQTDATWARITAGLLSGGALLVSLGGMLAMRSGVISLPSMMAAGSAYTIWALFRTIP